MVTITSPANPHIKELAKLLRRKNRDEQRRFLVEGRREVARAGEAGVVFDEILFSPELGGSVIVPGPVTEVSAAAFHKLSVRRHPDGVVAVAPFFDTALDVLIGTDLLLVAEGMEKPGNLGAMLRTADGCGAGILVADPVADVYNPNVIRASQGALFSVPAAVAEATAARAWVDERMQLVVATPSARRPYWELDLTRPTAVVIGAEHAGVTDAWSGGVEVAIPMRGGADSLNASVAAAVLLYEAVRQRAG